MSDLFSEPKRVEKHPLRDYQQAAVDTIANWCKYKDTPCIVDMATGSGKTHVINALIEHFYKLGQRVCLLAHRKELLEQSGGKITVPFGYYSASIGEKDTASQIIVGGVQSIYNKEFDKFDVIICDEAHHMPNASEEAIEEGEAGQYWQFIKKHQPCKLIGLTATPFRLKGGKLGWGDIIYEAKYPLLLESGYLVALTNKVKDTPDLEGVKLVAGEYNESLLSHVMEDPRLIDAAVKNIISYGQGRISILIFCVTVNHAKILTEAMKSNGLASAVLHGETAKGEREKTLEDFKSGRLHHLINCEILLEGFDATNIDMIVCLRPTKSKALWEQMLGRGVRLHEGKTDCFILDMAGNLMEHGGLGTPFFEKTKKEAQKEKGRICPSCETYCAPRAKECPDCGYIFPREDPTKVSHSQTADIQNSAAFTPLEHYVVKNTIYREHTNKEGKKSLRVDYVCNTRYGSISEWLSPHNASEYARGKAYQFFKERGWSAYGGIENYSMEDLLFHAATLKTPSSITVDHSAKFPRIVKYEWEKQEGKEEEKFIPIEGLLDDEIPW